MKPFRRRRQTVRKPAPATPSVNQVHEALRLPPVPPQVPRHVPMRRRSTFDYCGLFRP